MRQSIAGKAAIFVPLVATSLWKSLHSAAWFIFPCKFCCLVSLSKPKLGKLSWLSHFSAEPRQEEVVVAAKGGPGRSSTTGVPAMIHVPHANGPRSRFPRHWPRTPTHLCHAQRTMSLQRESFVLVQHMIRVILCNLPHALHLVPTIQRHPRLPKDVPRSWGSIMSVCMEPSMSARHVYSRSIPPLPPRVPRLQLAQPACRRAQWARCVSGRSLLVLSIEFVVVLALPTTILLTLKYVRKFQTSKLARSRVCRNLDKKDARV